VDAAVTVLDASFGLDGDVVDQEMVRGGSQDGEPDRVVAQLSDSYLVVADGLRVVDEHRSGRPTDPIHVTVVGAVRDAGEDLCVVRSRGSQGQRGFGVCGDTGGAGRVRAIALDQDVLVVVDGQVEPGQSLDRLGGVGDGGAGHVGLAGVVLAAFHLDHHRDPGPQLQACGVSRGRVRPGAVGLGVAVSGALR
jgi:hypothetical protein